jgi:hypothetical protein
MRARSASVAATRSRDRRLARAVAEGLHPDRDGALLREHARDLQLCLRGPAVRAEDQRELAERRAAEANRHEQRLAIAAAFVPVPHGRGNARLIERLPEVLAGPLDVFPDVAREAAERDRALARHDRDERAGDDGALHGTQDLEVRLVGRRQRERTGRRAGDLDCVADDRLEELVEALRLEPV